MGKICKYAIVACVAIGAKGFAQIGLPSKPEVSMTFDHPFLDASNYTSGVPNNQNKGLYFPTTDLTKWTFKTDNLDGITFPTAFNGMVVYNTGSGNTLADASKAGQAVTVEPGFYYFYNPDNIEGTSVVNGYWKAFNAGDTPSQPWYDAATQTQATDNTQNIYQMGRVGVYTQNPNATLQIDASGEADQPDGLLIPRILLSDLKAKDDTAYDVAQNATLIYVINDLGNGLPVGPPGGGGVGGVGPGGPASKTDYVLESGFYYYDANDFLWKAIETRAANGLTQTLYNSVKLGGQLSENTTLSGTHTLTLATPTTISGALKVTSGTPGAGKVLTSDATGNASWSTPENNWNLEGNELAVTDFIGSTNNADVVFKRNNIKSGLIGSRNTSFGLNSLANSTGSGHNTAIGGSALANNTTGYYNTALGFNALLNNIEGASNIAIGYQAMVNADKGVFNIAIGNNALANTKKNSNIAIGFSALTQNTLGESNVAIGITTLVKNIDGGNNTVLGHYALQSSVSGNSNTAIGASALSNLESGNENTVIGGYASLGLGKGDRNTLIGVRANTSSDISNSTAIGFRSYVTQSNSLILGSIRNQNTVYDDSSSTKVGIGTPAPVATLHIEADLIDNTRADALIIPRMTRVQLQAKDNAYGTEQDGAMVFVNNVVIGTPYGKTINVTSRGFYYYDAQVDVEKWVKF